MARYNLSSSQSDRITYDQAIEHWAQECFKESAPTTACGAEAARAHWALERALQEVDDLEEAEARYLDAFAAGWDAARREQEQEQEQEQEHVDACN